MMICQCCHGENHTDVFTCADCGHRVCSGCIRACDACGRSACSDCIVGGDPSLCRICQDICDACMERADCPGCPETRAEVPANCPYKYDPEAAAPDPDDEDAIDWSYLSKEGQESF